MPATNLIGWDFGDDEQSKRQEARGVMIISEKLRGELGDSTSKTSESQQNGWAS